MHHLVERPSENSYGKRFVIFQVVLPLQWFFLLSKLYKFWQHWFANFCFCQREPELPRFFISYYNRSRAKLYQSLFEFDIRHTKTHFKPLKFTNFCLFPKWAKWLCFKEPPNHRNKAKLHAIPIDRK